MFLLFLLKTGGSNEAFTSTTIQGCRDRGYED
jgi:hypothetical protein